jgi:hypothetical protein
MTSITQIDFSPNLYLNGLNYVVNPDAEANTITVSTGACRDSTDQFDLQYTEETTVSLAYVGLNGLDTGTAAQNTFYYLYAIASSSGRVVPGFILSTSTTQPTLPFQYDVFRLIGVLKTESGQTVFYNMSNIGTNNDRWYYYPSKMATAALTPTTTFTAVDLTSLISPLSTMYVMNWFYTPGVVGSELSIRRTGSGGSGVSFIGNVEDVATSGSYIGDTDSNQSIDYKYGSVSDGAVLYIIGFRVSF